MSEPECSSAEIFTGRTVRYVSVLNACESYYSNGKKTKTDCSPSLCLAMGLAAKKREGNQIQ